MTLLAEDRPLEALSPQHEDLKKLVVCTAAAGCMTTLTPVQTELQETRVGDHDGRHCRIHELCRCILENKRRRPGRV